MLQAATLTNSILQLESVAVPRPISGLIAEYDVPETTFKMFGHRTIMCPISYDSQICNQAASTESSGQNRVPPPENASGSERTMFTVTSQRFRSAWDDCHHRSRCPHCILFSRILDVARAAAVEVGAGGGGGGGGRGGQRGRGG